MTYQLLVVHNRTLRDNNYYGFGLLQLRKSMYFFKCIFIHLKKPYKKPLDAVLTMPVGLHARGGVDGVAEQAVTRHGQADHSRHHRPRVETCRTREQHIHILLLRFFLNRVLLQLFRQT